MSSYLDGNTKAIKILRRLLLLMIKPYPSITVKMSKSTNPKYNEVVYVYI